ncbi:MAG: phage tail tape measure protein [Desulfuromonadales bacterium]|nr:phage tail tape measure protein [Desulfuromonadales bacterium]
MESIFKLGILIKMTDMVSGPMQAISRSMAGLKTKAAELQPVFDKFKSIGMPLAAAGAAITAMLTGTVMATVASQKALGELSSVGVKDLRALEIAGQEFSNKWSGTTKAQFIAAAYDIKGGIASLSDLGVAEFAKLAALTGKATKSTTQEMTSLFATGYGIYKDQYKNLSDMQFGQIFSGAIAAGVNIFKSTGSNMAGAIENLGASATVAKIPLQEQITVLGMLQATMSGREAGTAYKAFFRDVGGAGKKLGLQFYDAAGNLKNITTIMGLLKGKFGDLSGVEGNILQKAFSDESYRMISQLYTKTGELGSNIQLLFDAMKQGTVYTEQMASAMNQDIGAGMGVLGQRLHNLWEILGKLLIPILAPLFTWLGNGILILQRWAEKHETLTRVIVVSLAVIGSLLFILGGLATVIGVIGLGIPAVITGMGLISGAFATATAGAWGFVTALWATGIPQIIIGIVALGAGLAWLYMKFETVQTAIQFFNFFLGYLLGQLVKVGMGFYTALAHPLLFIQSLIWGLGQMLGGIGSMMFNSGRMIVTTLVAGIKSMAMGPVNAIKEIFSKIRNLLPFSDAKEGPLSQLTLSGSRIMQTLGVGITGAAPGLHKAMAGALAGVALATSIGISPAMAALPKPQPLPVAPAFASAPGATNAQTTKLTTSGDNRDGRKTINIQHPTFNITLPNVSDGKSFMQELQRLVEGHDVN